MSLTRRLAKAVAASPLLARGRRLIAANERDWDLPLSKPDKAQAGAYLILRDYAAGAFPPRRIEREAAVASEIAYLDSLPGLNAAQVDDMHMRKPFWTGATRHHIGAFVDVVELLERLGVLPPSRLLELGCGAGWMSEMLALQRYNVVGTTLAPRDIALGERRVRALHAKGLEATLRFVPAAMEDVDTELAGEPPFDAAIVYEALHHAFDWRKAIAAAYRLLQHDGWLVICSEPNRMHTFVAYRVAQLSHTQEIGFSRADLVAALRTTGFRDVRIMRNRWHFGVRSHWIAARR